MNEILEMINICVQRGRINKSSNFPNDMKNMDGAVELTELAIKIGIDADKILNEGLLPAMKIVGEKFKNGSYYLPDVLISAKAMSSSMELLKPFFQSGDLSFKGKVILGTVAGDLHDIGKNIVRMVLEGGGWKVIDLGTNVSAQKFIDSLKSEGCNIVGLSALLTTTMRSMESITREIKSQIENACVIIGGAPVTKSFADSIKADEYFPEPQLMLDFINQKFA